MAFSIRLTEDERALAESYAKIHSYSLAEAFKKALFEKIEEEYDVAV
ncbi:MAG: antitoxin, partial [Clostridiaceae bacterium]|nr:antitoxin [Clostridiaceae bacterium]